MAACTLGLTLALCLAGAAGLLTFDAVAAAVGFVVGGGLTVSHAVVGHALERDGRRAQRNREKPEPIG
jgi:hypothetical protein